MSPSSSVTRVGHYVTYIQPRYVVRYSRKPPLSACFCFLVTGSIPNHAKNVQSLVVSMYMYVPNWGRSFFHKIESRAFPTEALAALGVRRGCGPVGQWAPSCKTSRLVSCSRLCTVCSAVQLAVGRSACSRIQHFAMESE